MCCPVVEDNSVMEIKQTYVDFAAFSGVPLQPRILPIFKANIQKFVTSDNKVDPKRFIPGRRGVMV